MTRQHAQAVVAALVAHYPGVALTDGNVNAYVNALLPLDQKTAMRAALTVARTHERMPSVAALLRDIGELLCDAPSAEAAWEEVRASFAGHQCYPTRCEFNWTPSHPVIGRTVDAIGYHALLHSTNPSADRAQFARLYGEFRTEAARSAVAGGLPAPQPAAQIMEGTDR